MKNNIVQKNIPQGWFETTLENECEVLKGQGLSKGKLLDGGKNECILYGELYTKYGEVVNVIKSYTDSKEGMRSKDGDILIPASTTTIAKDLAIATALNKDGVLLGGDINILRKKENSYDANFLAYYLTHYKNKELTELAQGITIIHLYGKDFKKLSICIPKKIDEQQKIAEILGAVDEDIAKTQEVIRETEKLKKGLMQELFTQGIGHTKFKETKLGKIPEEWDVIRLEEIAQVERGKFSHRPRNDTRFYRGNIPFIQTGDVISSNGRITKYSQTLNESGLKVSRMFKKGTIVLTIAANIGDTGILEFDSCFPDSLVGIISNNQMNNIFLEYFLRTRKEYLNKIATQSAQKNINLEKLRPLLIIKPKKDEQDKIAKMLSSVDEKISINKKLKSKLIQLKKGLAQDLLSGKVRV